VVTESKTVTDESKSSTAVSILQQELWFLVSLIHSPENANLIISQDH